MQGYYNNQMRSVRMRYNKSVRGNVMAMFYAIPVTSAGAERSFSKPETIKNHLQNSIGQDRLKY